MSAPTSDPFDLLRQVPLSEPDPARQEVHAEMARSAFLAEHSRRRQGWHIAETLQDWWSRPWRPGVALPFAGGLATMVLLAIWLEMPGQIAPQRDTPLLTDGEAQSIAPGTETRPGTRLGSQPPPVIDPDRAEVSDRYRFDGFEIVRREPPGQLVLSFGQNGQERPFTTLIAEQGVEFEILDAFVQARAEGDPLLLVRSNYGGFVNWDVYEMGPDAITLSARLSHLVHDAPSRADLVARLDSAL